MENQSVPRFDLQQSEVKEEKKPKSGKKRDENSKQRGRLFALMTYANEQDIKFVVEEHGEQIKHWCYICHDRDKKPDTDELTIKHYHVLIETFNPYYTKQIRNWFGWCRDEQGQQITTLAQIVVFRKGIVDYLTHENSPEKFRYEMSDVVNLADALLIYGVKPRDDEDNAICIINDMMAGKSYYELMRRYGREFIINNRHYRDMIALMISDGSLPVSVNMEDVNLRYRF